MMHNNYKEIPKDGLAGLKENWQKDVLSGFIVFMIALPLCLGIAMASGVPPMAGIIAAVVGGMVVSMISGSFVTINGPAAGLIVVILGAVETLGRGEPDPMAGYKYMIAAVVISGVILVIAGLLKAGDLGDFFPSAAVHGMLASIGIIIMSKQLHTIFGYKASGKDPIALISELRYTLLFLNPAVSVIGVTSLAILIILPFIKNKWVKMIPPPVIVVLVGVAMGYWFKLDVQHEGVLFGDIYEVGPHFLVNLPANIAEGITLPNFNLEKMLSYEFIMAVISISLVQGLETILSAKAVDQLDPYKRHSNLNRDLSAMGVGSVVSGMLGGLPMIAEIVRSSANVNNGAKTRWANFSHGVFLLGAVALIPNLIHRIPLASLAAILVFTGFRLASPKEFKLTYKIGSAQLLIFVSTIIATLATDLIIGIIAGIGVKILTHLYYGAPVMSLFRPTLAVVNKDEHTYHVTFERAVIFSNYLSVKKVLNRIPKGKNLVLDFSATVFIDHTVMEHLHHFHDAYKSSGGHLEIQGMDRLQPLSEHPLAARVVSREAIGLRLNQRQQHLAALAEANDYTFSPQKVLFDSKLKDLPFFSTRQLKHEENMLHKYDGKIHLQVSDITAREGAQITLSRHHFTGLLISDLPCKLPAFNLEKEHPVEKLMQKTGFHDVDFAAHPEFSDKFLLQGKNDEQLRMFFNPELIEMLLRYTDYHIESDGESLFIHKNLQLLKEKDVEELMQFGQEWLNILLKERKKVYA